MSTVDSLGARVRRPATSFVNREVALVLVALGVLNGSNYLLHVVVSRLLGPTAYGALAALLALLMVLSVPVGVVQTIVAKRVAALRGAGDEAAAAAVAPETLKGVAAPALLALGGLLLAAPALVHFLQVGLLGTVLLGPYTLLAVAASVPLGALQGRHEFGRLALATVASTVVRLAAAIGFVEAGLGVGGAILASLLAQAVLLVLAVGLLRLPAPTWLGARLTLEPFRGQVSGAVVGLGGFWLLAEADIVLGRHYLDHAQSGFYSAAGLLARGALFLPAAVSLAALPRFAHDRRRAAAYRHLRPALAAVAALALASLTALVLLRGPLVRVAFGPAYAPAGRLVPVLALAAALLAVVNLLAYFHIATETRANHFILAGLAVEVTLVAVFHDSAMQLAVILAGVAAGVAALQLYAAVAACREYPTLLDRRRGSTVTPRLEAAPVELSVVLPCHNAGPLLGRVLQRVADELHGVESYEIIVVSDGSTDETVPVASAFGERVRVLHYDRQVGKGHALQLGLSEACGRYVAFIDGDGDIDPLSIPSFVQLMALFEPDIVLGSKRHPLSDVSYPLLRRCLSWCYHKLGRVLFHIDVRDTQTGCKLIKREVLEAVLPRMLEKRYAFDLELLVLARSLGYDRILEAPVRIQYRFSSQVNVRAVLGIFRDTLAIFFRHTILNTYRTQERAAGAEPPPRRVSRRVRPRSLAALRDGSLRVLVLNWRDVGNPEAGGAETWTHEVATRWVAAGHEVSMLTSGFPGARTSEAIDGVSIRRLGRLRNGTFHLQVQRELARLRGFDVVVDEINSLPFLTPLWRHRLPPVVALVHQLAVEVWDYELPRPLAAVGRRLEPGLLRLYRDVPVVAVSESTRADLQALGLGSVHVVHGGLDPVPACAGAAKEAEPTFLFVGRLAANKRPEHAVAAFREILAARPDARLWIAGRGPCEQALAASLPARAELLGYVPREELYARLARAHALLVPSVREGWGLVVTEAASVGTPAVGYDVPGIRDSIVDGVTGLLARASEPAALAQAALELVADPVRYAQLQAAGLERAATFTWDATAEAFLTVVRAAAQAGAERTGPARPPLALLSPVDVPGR